MTGPSPPASIFSATAIPNRVIDITGEEPVEYRGRVPAGAVVVPGTRPKSFPSGSYDLQCALIIGQRSESTDRKTSLEDALRVFGVQA